jgi:hypothetical protein
MVDNYLRKRYKMDTWYGRTGTDVNNYHYWFTIWFVAKTLTAVLLLSIPVGLVLAMSM